MSYYVHNVPGRLRVKMPPLRNRPHRGERVRALLAGQSGVEAIAVNPLTGSVVVHYDSDRIDDQRILNVLRYSGLFDDRQVTRADEAIDRAATRAGRAVGRAVAGWALGKALEANGLSLLAALI